MCDPALIQSLKKRTNLLLKQDLNLVLEDTVLLLGPVLTASEAVQIHIGAFNTPEDVSKYWFFLGFLRNILNFDE